MIFGQRKKKGDVEKVKSAGGIVYYIDQNLHIPKFLVLKRYALSKKIERVAPKGKIRKGELPEHAALREIEEETGLKRENLKVKQMLDTLCLQLYNDRGDLGVDKDITYFLVQYTGNPNLVHVTQKEGFIGDYSWACIQDILVLVGYRDLRELFRYAYRLLGKISVKDEFLKNL